MNKKEYKDFLKFFDGKVPNPDQYPKRFEHFVRIYRHCNPKKGEMVKTNE